MTMQGQLGDLQVRVFPVAKQAQLAGLDEAATAALVKFRDELVVRIARFAQP